MKKTRIKYGKSNQYAKIPKSSKGYKQGYRYIDFGKYASSKTRLLKKKPHRSK